MAMSTGKKFGGAVAKLLGLPSHTIWFELRCVLNEPVKVKCEYYPDSLPVDENKEPIRVLAEHEAIERKKKTTI